ncbi:MAG: C10 family peptidase [Prevotellaceae bacterium]|nr:C10 family peptidase [Prevotellaceae bacterium]
MRRLLSVMAMIGMCGAVWGLGYAEQGEPQREVVGSEDSVRMVGEPEHHLLKRLSSRPVVAGEMPMLLNVKRNGGSSVKTRGMQQAEQRAALPARVNPLLANVNRWHQYSAPYWNMTPIVDGEHCPAGCVALAQAQVMHYWRYPDMGEGSHTYIDSLGCGQTLTADFAHKYDWGKMLYEYNEGGYAEDAVEPMACLLSDCGISVDMKYTPTASGAQAVMQPISLTSYFKYDKGVQMHIRDFYTREEMTTMLKTELAEGRPILISGYNYVGGHAFVIDGYNEDDWFHIMVGNPGGEGDGWTSLDCMNAGYGEHDSSITPESGFNLLQMFVTGVQPDNSPNAAGKDFHVYAMEGIDAIDTHASLGESMSVCVSQLANIGYNLHSDSVSVMLTRNGEIVCPLYTYDRTFALEEIEDTTYTDTLTISIPKTVSKGEYAIIPMFRDNGEWQQVRTSVGVPNYLLCTINNGGVTLSSDTANTAFLTMDDLDMTDLILNGTAPDISVTLTNHNAESNGRIYFLMQPLDEGGQAFFLYNQGYSMDSGETRTLHFQNKKIYAPNTGDYRLHILYENNILSSTLWELTDDNSPVYVSVLHTSAIQLAENQ